MSAAAGVVLRDATAADLSVIQRIYAHYVLSGLASFEEVPPDIPEIERRFRDIVARGLPYVVAEFRGSVAGYAYAGPYRSRSAYRFTVEDSVYVSPDAVGHGVGRASLAAVIRRTTAMGFRQMVAVIGDSGNQASIRLHEALGFRLVGTLHGVGFKLNRWVDSVLMQLSLGAGDLRPPTGGFNPDRS
jgi:phosphinothricin acetyltransferase